MVPKLLVIMAFAISVASGDINRQSIVFHEETPEVFYCPQEKPISLEGMIVKAKPLKSLCEHEGRGLPEEYKSDCWNDVDETEYACSEKKRILLQLTPPGSENAIIDNYVPIFKAGEYKIVKQDSQGKRIMDDDDEEEEAVVVDRRKPKNDF
jgi:hypothetical protein